MMEEGSGKFANLEAFINAASEFEATHSENAVNSMNRYLDLIASECDLSIFAPGRLEVCAFFSSLWRVMYDDRGPHWAGVAVLSRACIELSSRHALTHTYKFMPIMAKLVSKPISKKKKIKLLSVMQHISYGIKISWEEPYLSLLKQLTEWITMPFTDSQERKKLIVTRAIAVLVNMCSGNPCVSLALKRTVDGDSFKAHLIYLKDSGYGGVDVCRLLLCLCSTTCGAAAVQQADVNEYLTCAMRTFSKAVVDRDATQLLHAYTFVKDLCDDSNLRNMVAVCPNFTCGLQDSLKNLMEVRHEPDDAMEPEQVAACIQNSVKFLTVLISLDIYAFRGYHDAMLRLCLSTRIPETLELFAAVVLQYKGEGQLPHELILIIADSLPRLLLPPALEPEKGGLQWLQVVGVLCGTRETRNQVLQIVRPDSYEDTLYRVLEYTSQDDPVGIEQAQQAVTVGCSTALTLAKYSAPWNSVVERLLTHSLNEKKRKAEGDDGPPGKKSHTSTS